MDAEIESPDPLVWVLIVLALAIVLSVPVGSWYYRRRTVPSRWHIERGIYCHKRPVSR